MKMQNNVSRKLVRQGGQSTGTAKFTWRNPKRPGSFHYAVRRNEESSCQGSTNTECKFCDGSTSYQLPICNDCYYELGTGG